MLHFYQFIFSSIEACLLRILVFCIITTIVVLLAYYQFCTINGSKTGFPWKKILLITIFLAYLVALDYITLGRTSSYGLGYNFHLFRAWKDAWNNFTPQKWLNVLLNIAMFIPLGVMLPLFRKQFQKWYITLSTALVASIYIEICQLVTRRGLMDIDDLFCNTVGAMMGYLFISALISLKGNRRKCYLDAALKVLLGLTPVFAITGFFIAYSIQEFGNLPDSMVNPVNTNNISWKLDGVLPEHQPEVAIYRTSQRTLDDCDEFANAFKSIISTEYTTISYYQDAAYYMDQSFNENGSHILQVSYTNQGFTYSAHYIDDKIGNTCGTREEIESALSSFPVILSRHTQFVNEGLGWYRFTANKHIDGTNMIDGVMRCRVAEDGTILEIENSLHSYAYYRDAKIISPEQALAILYSGKFKLPEDKPVDIAGTYSIQSCSLVYRTDTKGFYQPVYLFDIAINYIDTITVIIPALL